MNEATTFAKILWDYNVLHQTIQKADCIIALGNSDIRTAHKAAALYHEGLGDYIVMTGGFGRLTKDNFTKPEAHLFADEAASLDVPQDKILLEDASTNTFDNIRFTKTLLAQKGLNPQSLLLVTKPYMERRALETAKAVWPGLHIQVTSPSLQLENYTTESIGLELLINMLVGDTQRLMIFSASNHITTQEFPKQVTNAYIQLRQLGYDKQIIPDEKIPDLLAAVTAGAAT